MGIIPKKIYTIWIGEEMPEIVKDCIKSQQIDGYEYIFINNDNYLKGNKYVDECIRAKKWVKAADYLRVYYLLSGGIYLDADTKVVKPFDDLLEHEMFVCEEENKFVSNGIFGVSPNHPLLTEYLRSVETNFIGSGDMVFQPGMYLWTELVKSGRWPNIKIYPPDWFIPYNHQTNKTNITENTHTYHYFLKSWLPK